MVKSSKSNGYHVGQCRQRTFLSLQKVLLDSSVVEGDFTSPGPPYLTEIPLRCSETNPLTRVKILQLPGVCFRFLVNYLQIVFELPILLCIEAAQSKISFKTFESWCYYFYLGVPVNLGICPLPLQKKSLVKWFQEMAFLLSKFRAFASGELNHTDTSSLPFTDDSPHTVGLL